MTLEILDVLKVAADAFVRQVQRMKELVIELSMTDIDFTNIPFLPEVTTMH